MPINLPDLRLGLKQINTGIVANDGQGDDLRTSFDKVNHNTNILAGMVGEVLDSAREYWVGAGGSDANSGLSDSMAFATINKAVEVIYNNLNLQGQYAVINLLPGDYVADVTIRRIPVGAFGANVPILIRKASGQAGQVFWTLDSTHGATSCLTLAGGAEVYVKDVEFRTAVPGVDGVHFVKIESRSRFYLGNCTFALVGPSTLLNASHIYCDRSEVIVTEPYTITGGANTHIILNNCSRLSTQTALTDPKVCILSGTVSAEDLLKIRNRSTAVLKYDNLRYQGNLQGRKFACDFTSQNLVDDSTYPSSGTVGLYETATISNPLNLIGAVSIQSSLNVTALSTFAGTTNFTGSASFSNTVAISGALTLSGVSTAPVQAATDNTNKLATTSFVQQVVQEKILGSVFLASPDLAGIVKINEVAPDPVVYVKTAVDTLLGAKAPINNPVFTGLPSAPTPASNDNSTQIATTAWVRTFGASISVIPAGTIVPFAGKTAQVPSGWLLCDGSYIDRSAYPNLFTAIGTLWGSSSPTDFRLPDLRDRMPMGSVDNGGTLADDRVGVYTGANSVTLTTGQLPAHNHVVSDPGHAHTIYDAGHSHAIYDPAHTHHVNDPGHIHAIPHNRVDVAGPPNSWNTDGSGIALRSGMATSPAATGVYLSYAPTGISIYGAGTGIGIYASGTGIQTLNRGNGESLSVRNAVGLVHYIIKT